MSARALALGTVAAVLVARTAGPRRRPRRACARDDATVRAWPGPLEPIGTRLLGIGGPADASSTDRRRAGAACLLAAATLPVFPPVGVAVLACGWGQPRLRRHRRAREARRAVTEGLPEAVDLLLLCFGAGLALPLAHPLVAAHLGPPIGPALDRAEQATCAGAPRADALVDELGPLGDRALQLGHLLADHLRYGVALAPALDRLVLELRLDRRRRAEQEARRVPVRLLGPLITCVLPAFGLLTVVPLLVASLQSLTT